MNVLNSIYSRLYTTRRDLKRAKLLQSYRKDIYTNENMCIDLSLF